MLNLVDVQDAIFSHLENELPVPLVEQGIPDAQTVRKVKGRIEPYVAIQFGDLQHRVSGRTLVGARTYDYELPIYIQTVASDASVARRLASGNVLSALLGISFDWTGELNKRPGGGMFSMTNSNGATEAYMFPSSWGITVQIEEA